MEYLYDALILKNVVEVSAFVSINYFEFGKDFFFPEETHRCWEIIYVDKGVLFVSMNGIETVIKQGEFAIYPPMMPHSNLHNAHTAPNACGIAFESDSEALYQLAGRVIPLSGHVQKQLALIISQAYTICPDGLTPTAIQLIRNDDSFELKSALQLMKLYMEEMLIYLLKEEMPAAAERRKATTENAKEDSIGQIQEYIRAHLDEPLPIDGICSRFLVGKTVLCRDFKRVTGATIKEFISDEKLKCAKDMIRKEQYNFTEIAERLGFTSLYYFSTWFKKKTQRTPTEYALSVQTKYKQ